ADVTGPGAVTLVDASSWQDGVAASVLFANPLRAPILLTHGGSMPGATGTALASLNPQGAPKADDAQVIRVGSAAQPRGLRTKTASGNNVFATAAKIDKPDGDAARKPPSHV